MSHDFCRDHLGQYLDQSLDPIEREKVEIHLQGCAQCAQIAREMASIRAAMRDMAPFAAPVSLRQNVRAALQNERNAPAARLRPLRWPQFRGPQLAWSGTLAVAAFTMLVLARPFATRPVEIIQPAQAPGAASSGAPNASGDAAPTSARGAVGSHNAAQKTAKSSAQASDKPAANQTVPAADRVAKSGSIPTKSVRPKPAPALATAPATVAAPESEIKGSAPAKRKPSEASHDQAPPSARQGIVPVAPMPQSERTGRADEAAAPSSRPVSRPSINASKPQPARGNASSALPSAAPSARSSAAVRDAASLPASGSSGAPGPAPVLGRVAPNLGRSAPTTSSPSPVARSPRLSRSQNAPAPNAERAASREAAPSILRQKKTAALSFSFGLRAVSGANASPSSATDAPGSASTSAALPALSRSAAGAASGGAASSQRGEAERGASNSAQKPNALNNAAPPQNNGPMRARFRTARPAVSPGAAPKIGAQASGVAGEGEVANGSVARRFRLQVRVTGAAKNARIRLEVAPPARLVWPGSGVVWSGDLTAGTPLEIAFSLRGVRGGEKISVVVEQKTAGAPSRIIETQTLSVPPAQ